MRTGGALFLIEAALYLFVEWSHCLAWLNPLLLGMGLLELATPVGGSANPGGEKPSGRRVSGIVMIVCSFVLLGFRLTRL